MNLNQLAPNAGAKATRERVGRGIGCGKGKTCGRGHKGQKSRRGASRKAGFEGGQMPLIRRLPKFGFTSFKATQTAEIRLDALNRLPLDVITIEALQSLDLLPNKIKYAKIVNSGDLEKKVTIKGIRVTKSAQQQIEKLGGSIED